MKQRFLAGCLVVAAFAAPVGAQAADLSLAPLYKAPPAQYSPAYNWSGFYLGLNGGGGWGDLHWQGIGHTNLSGGQVGGTAGYNWQFGQAVLGLEGDLDWNRPVGHAGFANLPGRQLLDQRYLAIDRARPRRLLVRPHHALCDRRPCGR